jgi:glycosyltransferase involved in cell wall biosynthesis
MNFGHDLGASISCSEVTIDIAMEISKEQLALNRRLDESRRYNERPLVTIICTAKNAALTIEDMLRSVRLQSIPGWELLVVDDGSHDATVDLVSAFAQQEPRLRLIVTKGIGRGRALNLALKEADSPFIVNLDADDVFHPDFLRVMLDLYRNQQDYFLICTSAPLFKNLGTLSWNNLQKYPSLKDIDDVTDALLVKNPVCHSSVMFDRQKMLALSGYNEAISSQFDYELWVRVAQSGYRIGKLRVPLVAKRIHNRQSFEAKARVAYRLHSMKVQSMALRTLGGRWYHWLLMYCRFAWGIFPLSRVYLTRSIK